MWQPSHPPCPFVDSTPIRHDAPALRQRARQDGYLFFRGLLDREAVLDVRRQFCAILQEMGWLEPGSDPLQARTTMPRVMEGEQAYYPMFDRFQQLQDFHALAHQPGILDVLGKVFGEPVLVHPRNIGRVIHPQADNTPPHQDYFYIRGTFDTWTGWAPLGDCPIDLGGIALMPGSHHKGVLPTRPMPGAGGHGIEVEAMQPRWLTIDYRAGDMVLLHSLTIHAGMPPRIPNVFRLSADYRYQPVSHEVDRRSLLPHMGRFGWDFVYRTWPPASPLREYWKDMPLKVVDAFAGK